MHDAITTAMGKPGSPMKVDLHRDTGTGKLRMVARPHTAWDAWQHLRAVAPGPAGEVGPGGLRYAGAIHLTAIDAGFRRKLLEERDEGRADSRLKARFLSFRLNVPTADESELLLTVDDLKLMFRDVPVRKGRPIVSVDLGAGRAWSAAVAIFEGGRIEAIALAPGLTGLDDQEKRDRVPPNTYVKLAERGLLLVADGLMVPPPSLLWDAIKERWGLPQGIVCDRFQLPQLQQAVAGQVPIAPRMTRWSESTEDIKCLRSLTRDGPLAAEEESRPLLAASLSVARVKNDDSGGTRLVKRGFNNDGQGRRGGGFDTCRGEVSAFQPQRTHSSARRCRVGRPRPGPRCPVGHGLRAQESVALDRDGWRCQTCGRGRPSWKSTTSRASTTAANPSNSTTFVPSAGNHHIRIHDGIPHPEARLCTHGTGRGTLGVGFDERVGGPGG